MARETNDPDAVNMLVLEQIDRSKNVACYALLVELTLFAESALVRR